MRRCCFILLLALPLPGWANGYDQIRYLDNDAFLQQGFVGEAFRGRMLMLDPRLRQRIETILQRPWLGMRLRYWQSASRSAWIIDEVGKDLPITIGVVVGANGIEQVRILVYREPRGGEVHEAFFTRQFERLTLANGDRLSADIDNITGATLSVNAVSRVAALALALHQQVNDGVTP